MGFGPFVRGGEGERGRGEVGAWGLGLGKREIGLLVRGGSLLWVGQGLGFCCCYGSLSCEE